MKQYAAIDDVVYFWFGANDTSGSGGDGASPAADVRLAGAAADAIPVYSPTPTLLSHANYPAGAYEIAITASAANGFATGNTYAVFCTLAIDSQNPTGFVGSFDLKPVESNPTQLAGVVQSLTDLKDLADTGYDPVNHKIQSDLIYIHGSALTETAGQLAAAFTKLFDVATPLLVASDVMRGTDLAALAATALTDVIWTDAKAAFIDVAISSRSVTNEYDTVIAALQTDLDNPAQYKADVSALATSAALATHDGKLDTVDGNVDAILLDTGTDGVLLSASATSAQLIDDNWDEILTGATHNIATSAGRRVREIAGIAIQTGTAQAATVSTITIDAAANGGDGVYNRNLLVILDGTGKGQTRTIVDYNDTTKVCLIDREWRITPDATSEYQILADDTPLVVDHGLTQATTNTTITIRDYASAIDETYTNAIINIMAGTGKGQSRIITAYNGTTKVVTVCTDWETNPDATSVYVIMPYGISSVACMSDGALAAINAEVDTALVDYNFNDISVADIIAGIADGTNDLQEMMRIMFAALSGKSSGGGTATLTFRDSGDAKDRITATVDANGNRTAMTLDGS